MFRRYIAQWCRRDDGAVAIEFALLGPILFALLFSIVCVGYALTLSHSVHQLASYTARASVLGIDQAERLELAEAYIEAASANYPLLVQSSITPNLTMSSQPNAAIHVDIAYALDGSVLELASGFLGLNWTHLEGSAYLAY